MEGFEGALLAAPPAGGRSHLPRARLLAPARAAYAPLVSGEDPMVVLPRHAALARPVRLVGAVREGLFRRVSLRFARCVGERRAPEALGKVVLGRRERCSFQEVAVVLRRSGGEQVAGHDDK